MSKRNGNGHRAADEQDTTNYVRLTYDNKIRATTSLRKRADESPKEWRERCERTISKEWSCAVPTLRAFLGSAQRRRPTRKKNPRFFDDLKKFGAAKFDEKGRVIRETLGLGMDPLTFLDVAPAGSDARRAVRRSIESD